MEKSPDVTVTNQPRPRGRKGVNRKHGMEGTSVYRRWSLMKQRCLNKKDKNYPGYGARGITVCERWLKFENFYVDMGDPPPNKTLDRIDNDGNYEPGNCRWATISEQQSNRRKPKPYKGRAGGGDPITIDGVTLPSLAAWSRRQGIPLVTICDRLDAGWPLAKAILTDPAEYKSRKSGIPDMKAYMRKKQREWRERQRRT